MKRALPIVLLAALAFPAASFAHASLRHESPSFKQRLSVSPRQVVLQFDQPVVALPNAIQVLTLKGKNVAGPARAISSQRELVASLPRLPKGPYTLRWQAVSNDGHIVSGVYTFGVRVNAPPVTDAVGAQGPTRAEDIVRWLYFLALALSVGGLGFLLLVVPGRLPARAQRRFYWITGVGVVAALELNIVSFLLRGEDALQLPFGRFLYGDLSPLAGGTRFGKAFVTMELGFALILALVFLAWLTERRAFLWAAFALGLVFASGLSLSGHDATETHRAWLAELADWVHLTAAMLWVGGLVQLVAVVWPAAPQLRRAAILRFSRLATVLVALLLTAGTYLSILRFPHVHDLWTTGYGHVLLVKLGLVATALLWGGAHQFIAIPRIDRPGVIGRLSRSLLGEASVAMAVLLLAAVLTDSKPPPQPSAPSPVALASHARP
ncbi:MAG TPA: copper resistance protein CopC [Gaiellaceae bacterium]|nr:copper resistance protein CopC [Gaiellaceae bacterium]